jgi:ParB-like chromosome segregation protein Spo0J
MARKTKGAKPPPLPAERSKSDLKREAVKTAGTTLVGGEPKTVAIDDVRRHPENARAGNIESIKASIRANGFYGRLVVQRSTNFIVVGNHRWQAAKDLGFTAIPIELVDVDERQARRMLAVDNRTSDLADYDNASLAPLLKQLMADGDLEAAGYRQDDLDAVLKKISTPPPPDAFQNLDPGGMHLARKCPRCAFEF